MRAKTRVVIIGGGAAGIFAAIICAEKNPHAEIIVLEKTQQLLAKVRISGGGRCNVTHAEFDPKKLSSHYPRGHKELISAFHHFQPRDTIQWFKQKGVLLKTEEDGRLFPITDSSETIISCLLSAATKGGVDIRCGYAVGSIEKQSRGFLLHIEKKEPLDCDYLLLATGSSPKGHALAASLGHTIVPAVPSLFTFNTPTSPLLDLSGIAISDVLLSLKEIPFQQRGALLLTHWGFSGPAALKLSAWAARALHSCHYQTELFVNWVPSYEREEVYQLLCQLKQQKPMKTLENENPFHLPLNLWKRLLKRSLTPLGHLSHAELRALSDRLHSSSFKVEGKTTYKSEFVTAGGVLLREVDFKTMQSRLIPSLFFAGELLDIDGVTGGFNFQNAWTSAYLSASAIANDIN